MSIARLAGLIARAAAPASRAHRAMPESAQPAFDAPAAIGTAMLSAGIAAAPPPPGLRRAAAAAPPLPSPQPMRHRIEARVPAPPSGVVAESSTSAPAPPSASAALPPPKPPPGRVTVTLAPSDALPTVDALPATQEAAPMPATPPLVPVAMADAPVAITVEGPELVLPIAEPVAALDPLDAPAPAILPQRVMRDAAAPPSHMPTPAAPAAPAPPPISIGTVEVVIAAPPQRPAPAPRPTPDRSFTRYAAMRSGRDRAW